MIIMKYLESILIMIQDSKWHKIDEINKNIPISILQLNGIISFLQEHSLLNNENMKIRITNKGLRFLDLPI